MPTIGDIVLTIAPYVVGFLFAFISFIIFRFSKQRKLYNFLKPDKEKKQTLVYLSSLLIPRGGAVGFDGRPRSYQGITIPTEELSISSRLVNALAIDVFEYIPPIVRKKLQEKFAFFRPLAINVTASPMQEQEIDFSTRSIITVGSQGYNVVTNYVVSHNLCQAQISHNGMAIQINKGKGRGEVIRPATNQHDIAVLERVIDSTSDDTTIFVCAGLGVVGTMGAIQYLVDHWEELSKVYKDQEFAIILQFGPVGQRAFDDTLKGAVIRRIPE